MQSTPVPPVVTPTPTPTPAPAPAPAPTPTPSTNDTGEYRATVGAVSMNALAAYDRGATGAGVAVGIVDTGIDLQSAEFGSRISATSANVAGGTTVDDEDGHGTAVAFTLAGRRNGVATHGVAFDATIVAARADAPGTCAGSAGGGTAEAKCGFYDSAIARGIDLARTSGARVVNLSLGGSAPGGSVIAAIDRATAAGIVVVIAAGNDGSTDVDPFAAVAGRSEARGLVVIAGSVGANDTRTAGADAISSFSDRAGSQAAHYIAAVGERVRAPDASGTAYLWSGTSFAAPQVSAAVALLAQAFPNLTGAQIVDILFRTARDAGASGVDAVYGQGVLDLTRAFQPIGTTSVAGTSVLASTISSGTLSAPMADGGQGTLGAVILDGYSRAFATDFARSLSHAQVQPVLAPALLGRQQAIAIAGGSASVAMTIAPGATGVALTRTYLARADAEAARAIAGSIAARLGRTTAFAIGVSQGSGALVAGLAGASRPAFLVSRDADGAGFDHVARSAVAVRQQLGRWGLTTSAENGEVLTRDATAQGNFAWLWDRAPYQRSGLAVDRRVGPLALTIGASRLDERRTLLGARLGPALGAPAAASWFADVEARAERGGWSVGAMWRRGWTHARLGGIAGVADLASEAYALDVGRAGLFGADRLSLRLSQPLRVTAGGLAATLPTGYDYATESVTQWTRQTLSLTPTGRERDAELAYARPLWGGAASTNLFWRRDPGHIAAAPDDLGLALRWGRGF